jgi:hypothetical protein
MIADLEKADFNYRIQSLILSSCFLEISSLNINLDLNEDYFFYSSYYNAMVNHKLAILLGDDRDSYIYINSALTNYIKSTQADDYAKQRALQYTYIKQITVLGKEFIKKFGYRSGFPTLSEFDKINKDYDKKLKGY